MVWPLPDHPQECCRDPAPQALREWTGDGCHFQLLSLSDLFHSIKSQRSADTQVRSLDRHCRLGQEGGEKLHHSSFTPSPASRGPGSSSYSVPCEPDLARGLGHTCGATPGEGGAGQPVPRSIMGAHTVSRPSGEGWSVCRWQAGVHSPWQGYPGRNSFGARPDLGAGL